MGLRRDGKRLIDRIEDDQLPARRHPHSRSPGANQALRPQSSHSALRSFSLIDQIQRLPGRQGVRIDLLQQASIEPVFQQ
jgi:hypothetical protein